MKTLLSFLLFLIVITLANANVKPRKFTVYSPNSLKTSETLYYSNGKSFKPLVFVKGARSKTYTRAISNSFEIFTSEVSNGKTIYVSVGIVSIDPQTERHLFLIEPSTMKEKLRITALDDTVESFPRGSYKYYNLTKFPITANLNGSISTIPPQRMTQVCPNIPNGGALIPFYLHYKNQTLYESRLYCQSSERRIIFITRNHRGDTRRPVRLSFLPQLIGPNYN